MIMMCWLYEMFGMRPEECFSYVAKLSERMKIFQVANYGYIFFLIPMNLHLSLAEMAVWPSVTGLIESRYWLPLINHLVYEEETEE